jgi:hypothetical protein
MGTQEDLFGIALAIVGGMAAAAILSALFDNSEHWLNRYQIGIEAKQPPSKVREVLEALSDKGLVQATGDPSDSNHRSYRVGNVQAA